MTVNNYTKVEFSFILQTAQVKNNPTIVFL